MESRKEVKKKINVLEAMHYIMTAWQQITQQTIQNCFRKAGYKYPSNVNEMANDDGGGDDFGEDWEELCGAQKYDFQNYVSVDCDVEQVAFQLLKNYAKCMDLQGVWRKRIKKTKMKKIWCQASPRLTKL
jgi:hypothetical protein